MIAYLDPFWLTSIFVAKTAATRSILPSPKLRRHFFTPTFRARPKSFVAYLAILIAYLDPPGSPGRHPLINGFPSVFSAGDMFARPPRDKSFVAYLAILIAYLPTQIFWLRLTVQPNPKFGLWVSPCPLPSVAEWRLVPMPQSRNPKRNGQKVQTLSRTGRRRSSPTQPNPTQTVNLSQKRKLSSRIFQARTRKTQENV